MKVQDRDCTLTVAKDNECYPLQLDINGFGYYKKNSSILELYIKKKESNVKSISQDGFKIP